MRKQLWGRTPPKKERSSVNTTQIYERQTGIYHATSRPGQKKILKSHVRVSDGKNYFVNLLKMQKIVTVDLWERVSLFAPFIA